MGPCTPSWYSEGVSEEAAEGRYSILICAVVVMGCSFPFEMASSNEPALKTWQ